MSDQDIQELQKIIHKIHLKLVNKAAKIAKDAEGDLNQLGLDKRDTGAAVITMLITPLVAYASTLVYEKSLTESEVMHLIDERIKTAYPLSEIFSVR